MALIPLLHLQNSSLSYIFSFNNSFSSLISLELLTETDSLELWIKLRKDGKLFNDVNIMFLKTDQIEATFNLIFMFGCVVDKTSGC